MKMKIKQINEELIERIKNMVLPLTQDDLLEKNYANETTIAVGQDFLKLSKKRI